MVAKKYTNTRAIDAKHLCRIHGVLLLYTNIKLHLWGWIWLWLLKTCSKNKYVKDVNKIEETPSNDGVFLPSVRFRHTQTQIKKSSARDDFLISLSINACGETVTILVHYRFQNLLVFWWL